MSSQLASNIQSLKHIQQLLQQGELVQSEHNARALLSTELDADSKVSCWYLIAVGKRLQQQHESAIDALQSLLSVTPEHARAHQEMGYNYRALQQTEQASTHFYRATQINPALLSAWNALLPIYQQAKQTEASALCQHKITSLVSLPKPILAATDLFYDNKLQEADIACRHYLQQHKQSLEGLLLLAEIAIALKAPSEAEFLLETCVELHPTSEKAKYQLFKVYSKLGKFAPAFAITQVLLKQETNNIVYQVAQAAALQGLGNVEEAIAMLEKITASNHANANVYLVLGHAYKTQGNIALSVAAYQKSYALMEYYGDAYWSLANTKTYAFSENEMAAMRSGVESNRVSVEDKIHLHFALGKALEDKHQYNESYPHYAAGNTLKAGTLTYSHQRHADFVSAQIESFTPNLLADLNDVGCDNTAPIFIVGMPRAGSTLLEQILASHSHVDGTMELHEVLGLAAKLSKKQDNNAVYPRNLKDIPSQYFSEFGKKFIDDTKVYRKGAAYFIDKMPNNYMHIGLIKLILPRAKIIDARREAMACCFSGFKQLFGEGQEFSYSLKDIALYYQNYIKLMDHWQALFPGQILKVQHEDVVNDTENQVRRLLDFCGLPFEQSCLDFHKNKRAVNTPSAQQVRQPIYTSGLEQWRNFEEHLGELKAYFKQ